MGKINKGMMSSESSEWGTPKKFFGEVDHVYGPFTLDVCATVENTKCPVFFDKEADGLKQPWYGNCWMNPPYGKDIKAWMHKAYHEVRNGNATQVVCLVPARTDTAWWHDYAMKGQVTFIRGRLQFEGGKSSAPFPSALVVFS